MSWIALDDLVGVIRAALSDQALTGPVNAVSPNPVTNNQFAKTLGRVLGRPAVLHVPAFVLRIALGQMADELLLASARVVPSRLEERGVSFQYAELEAALRHLLGKADE
jgi:NAD dependent epimerase/dehydratase family enzyme